MYHHKTRSGSLAEPTVTVAIDEQGGKTHARVELIWGSAQLAGNGVSYRHPADCLAGETRRELATARALADLAERVTTLLTLRG